MFLNPSQNFRWEYDLARSSISFPFLRSFLFFLFLHSITVIQYQISIKFDSDRIETFTVYCFWEFGITSEMNFSKHDAVIVLIVEELPNAFDLFLYDLNLVL